MGWNPRTGMYEPDVTATPPTSGGPLGRAVWGARNQGYGSGRATRISGKHPDQQAKGYLEGSLLPAERGAEGMANRRAGMYEDSLYDIEGTVDRFSDIYRKAGEAIAAPAQRDYQQHAARVGANAASRFGGNVSSEELRQGYNTGDLFSRNLSEAMARLGGEQVGAGLNYTGQLGGAAAQAAEERDRLRQMILQGISYAKPRAKPVGEVVGGIVASAAGGAASKLL